MKAVSFARLIASGLGSGLTPVASGTFGSLAAMVAWLVWRHLIPTVNIYLDLALAVATLLVGVAVSNICLANPMSAGNKRNNLEDPGYIVIDEWAGIFVALIAVPAQPLYLAVLGFVLFRFFDIIKIGPIRSAEALPHGWGIMMDDIVAGACAAVVLGIVRMVL